MPAGRFTGSSGTLKETEVSVAVIGGNGGYWMPSRPLLSATLLAPPSETPVAVNRSPGAAATCWFGGAISNNCAGGPGCAMIARLNTGKAEEVGSCGSIKTTETRKGYVGR